MKINEILKEFGEYQIMLSKIMTKQHRYILYKDVAVVNAEYFMKIYDMLSPGQKQELAMDDLIDSAFVIELLNEQNKGEA